MLTPKNLEKAQAAAQTLQAKELPEALRQKALKSGLISPAEHEPIITLERILEQSIVHLECIDDFLDFIINENPTDPMLEVDVIPFLRDLEAAYTKINNISAILESLQTAEALDEKSKAILRKINKDYGRNLSQIEDLCEDLRDISVQISTMMEDEKKIAALERYIQSHLDKNFKEIALDAFSDHSRKKKNMGSGIPRRHPARPKPISPEDVPIIEYWIDQLKETYCNGLRQHFTKSPERLEAAAEALSYYEPNIHAAFGLAEGKDFGKKLGGGRG